MIEHLVRLASRPGHQLTYSVGWDLGERAAITAIPERAWQNAIGPRGVVRERRAGDACPAAGCAHARCWIEEGAEPKTIRYRILHAAARLTRSGRRRRLKIPATWPWACAIAAVWNLIAVLPQAP